MSREQRESLTTWYPDGKKPIIRINNKSVKNSKGDIGTTMAYGSTWNGTSFRLKTLDDHYPVIHSFQKSNGRNIWNEVERIDNRKMPWHKFLEYCMDKYMFTI